LEKTYNILKQIIKKGDVILFLGAGNITRLADKFAEELSKGEL